jgi:hypothetical protein
LLLSVYWTGENILKSRRIMLVVVCGFALFLSPAAAQVPVVLGPTVLTRGVGDIGSRSGSAVDFRLFAGVSAIYDNGVQPVSVNSAGQLFTQNGLYGTEVSLGVYGQHPFKHAKLGLDYQGTYRHYNSNTYWDGSDHQLALGYTYQKSQRITFDLRQVAGTSSLGSSFAGGLPTAFNTVVDPTTLLFDNRTFYLQSTMDVTYTQSLRNSFTVGGNWSTVQRQSSALVGTRTYGLNGSFQRRQSQNTTFGATYQHMHYDFPQGFGESDINTFQGFWTRAFGRSWSLSIHAGIYESEVIGLQLVALDPAIAALFGTSTIIEGFYRKNFLPSADAALTRSSKRSVLTVSYSRSISPGNGVYLTSRQELAGASYAYTGLHKWTFNVTGNYGHLTALGQGLATYKLYSAGSGLTYAITRALYATAHYDPRHYDIAEGPFRRTAYRVMVGLSFSPAEIPLSFR